MDKLTPEEKEEALDRTAVIKLKMVAQMLNCLEVASSRGAYRANEMTYVGSLYDILSKGLQTNFVQYIEEKGKVTTVKEEVTEEKVITVKADATEEKVTTVKAGV